MKALWALGLVVALVMSVTAQTSTIVTNGNEAATISYVSYNASSISTTSQGIRVWSFNVTDTDGDSDPTYANELRITAGSGAVNWGNSIKAASIFDGGVLVSQAIVQSGVLRFQKDGGSDDFLLALDNTTNTIDLYVSFNAAVQDNDHLEFEISSANVDAALFQFSSSFAAFATATSSSAPTANKIGVAADRLSFSGTISTVFPDSNFSVTINATDVNSNIDVNAAGSVTISRGNGTGTLSSALNPSKTKSLVSGSVSWSDLRLDAQEDSVTLIASGPYAADTSNYFTVTSALFLEDFEYSPGASLSLSGWTELVAPTSFSMTASGAGLSYTDYPGSGVGLRTFVTAAADESVYNSYPSQSADSLYLSMIVNLTSAGTGDMFASLGPPSPESTNGLRACLFAKDASGSLKFGIGQAPESVMGSGANYTTETYTYNNPHIVIVKYTFVPGTNNDRVDLFVDEVGATEPATPTLTASVPGSDLDPASLASIALLQMSANGPTGEVDAIRVSQVWTSATTILPVQLTHFNAFASMRGAHLVWSTAMETNSAGFEVERRAVNSQLSTVGRGWMKIAFVPGAGTSTSTREYSFTDTPPASGRYAYRLKQIDRDGAFTIYGEVEVEVGATTKEFRLGEAYPNPFNPTTAVEFSLADAGLASVKVYNVLGQEVATLFNGVAEAGRLYRATWDASSMPSGIYFARLESGGKAGLKRLMLVK